MSAPTRRPNWNLPRKLLTRARKGRNVLVPSLRPGFPRKSASSSIATCARGMGARIPHTTLVIVVGLRKNRKEKSDFRATKKGGKKANPVNQNFAQLTKKIEKLEIALKRSSKKAQKRQYEDSSSDSE
jgi:hypothetical protein